MVPPLSLNLNEAVVLPDVVPPNICIAPIASHKLIAPIAASFVVAVWYTQFSIVHSPVPKFQSEEEARDK